MNKRTNTEQPIFNPTLEQKLDRVFDKVKGNWYTLRMGRIYSKEAFWAEVNNQNIESRFELELMKNPSLHGFYTKKKESKENMTLPQYLSGLIGFWSHPLYALGYSVMQPEFLEP